MRFLLALIAVFGLVGGAVVLGLERHRCVRLAEQDQLHYGMTTGQCTVQGVRARFDAINRWTRVS